MAMKRCPVCGEKYSDTYKDCPFCEEEEALRQGDRIRRSGGRGGKRAASQPSLLSPVLIVLIILMACLLVYLLFGDRILGMLQGDEKEDSQMEEVIPQQPDVSDETDVPENDGTMPGDEDVEQQEGADAADSGADPQGMNYEKAAALPAGLTLSSTDFSLFSVGENSTLTVTGGNGTYQWFSEDDGVASVDKNGKVTAVSKGDVNIVVTDGEKQGTCIVRVKISGTSSGGQTGQSTSSPASTTAKLSSTDFTIYVGDPDVPLTVSGVSSGITWASKNTAVATVSSSGVVKAVGTGTTTVTASWNGQTLECIVRVPGVRK